MAPQDKKAETPETHKTEQPSRRRLEQLASLWASQTGRKIVIA